MKDKILSFLFVFILTLFMLLSFFLPSKEISVSERRKLQTFPELKKENVLQGTFFADLNSYLVDHFPIRDSFKKMKSLTASFIFQKKEEDGIFIKDDGIYELSSNLNEKSVSHFADLLLEVQEKYIESSNVFYAVVPDKNYYLDAKIPKLDYQQLDSILFEKLTTMEYIDLYSSLQLESYYRTDIHWRQEKLDSVLFCLKEKMSLENFSFPTHTKTYSNFQGALYRRIANTLEKENIITLLNEDINSAVVYDYEKRIQRPVYVESDFKNIDSYDIYLGGAKPLLIIENPNQKNNRELILFRDSFGSSLAPLLISNYSKITMIDLRYLNSKMISNIEEVEFKEENQDILFLYSVPVINNSYILK